MGVLFYFIMYDKIVKIKEEFNILICSCLEGLELLIYM